MNTKFNPGDKVEQPYHHTNPYKRQYRTGTVVKYVKHTPRYGGRIKVMVKFPENKGASCVPECELRLAP